MSRATLQRIAEVAGCSRSVASAVLNKSKGNIRVSEELRQRIITTAESLSYRPNFAARSLARQSTRTMGFYVTPHPFGSIAQAYEGGIFRGIEKACRENRFSLLVLNLTGSESPEFCLEQIQEQRIDGLILLQTQPYSEWERKLMKQVGTMVVIGPAVADLAISSLDFDNAAGIGLAVSHLVELGHRKIGYIGSCLAEPSSHALERLASFRASIAKHGLALPREYVFDKELMRDTVPPEHNYCMAEGYFGARHMMSLDAEIRPTALVAYNDQAASGVYRYAHEKSLRLPEVFSLVGVDNENFCEVLTPRLTSIVPPLGEMGYRATLAVIEQIRTQNEKDLSEIQPGQRTLFRPEIRVRESTVRIGDPAAVDRAMKS